MAKLRCICLLLSVSAFFLQDALAVNTEYLKQESIYKELCETLERPNVDCECVAKSHATYAHLSPNDVYANYLVESYKDRIGIPNQRENAFKLYANGRKMDEVQIEMYNAFSQYESSDPFLEEVQGCLIPDAAKVMLKPLPSAPIFKEVFDYRVSSSGAKRYEQCILVETSEILSSKELVAWHYRIFRGLEGDELASKLNLTQAQAEDMANAAGKKIQNHNANKQNISNYCSALLVAEDDYGELQTRFMRSGVERAGKPVGLAGIDTTSSRAEISNVFGDEIDSIKQDINDLRAQNANPPSAKKLTDDVKNTQIYQTAKLINSTQASNATVSLLSKGCQGAGRTPVFCSCFVETFMADIGEAGGAAALPVINEGISSSEVMALMKSIDQSRYMQDMSKAMAISQTCETAEN
jgi:hypothetical protein